MVLGPDGKGLGDAQVMVGGSVTSGSPDGDQIPSTTSLTTGKVGAFAISGLKAPGDYTLTVSRDGLASETVPVHLTGRGPPKTVEVRLGTELGIIRGRVEHGRGSLLSGATVTATDGTRTFTATSSSPGGLLAHGGYLIASLPPGTYSVTATHADFRQVTAIVTVKPGRASVQHFTLESVD
jgi:hypothetical protein